MLSFGEISQIHDVLNIRIASIYGFRDYNRPHLHINPIKLLIQTS